MNYKLKLYFSEPNNDDPLNAEAAKYWNKESKCCKANCWRTVVVRLQMYK